MQLETSKTRQTDRHQQNLKQLVSFGKTEIGTFRATTSFHFSFDSLIFHFSFHSLMISSFDMIHTNVEYELDYKSNNL